MANGSVCPELFYKTKGKYSICASDEDGGEGDLSANQQDTITGCLNIMGSMMPSG